MRNGWRKVLASLGLFLLGTGLSAAPFDMPMGGGSPPIRLTIQVTWAVPASSEVGADEACALDLELTEGRVLEAIAWPTLARGGSAPGPRAEGGWRLGAERSGRIRARIEAPVGASLQFHARGQVISVPIAPVLEGPRQTPPQAPIEIEVERLPWDALNVALDSGDGTVEPGGKFPLRVGFNILTPEPADLAVHCTAALRPASGGDAVWRDEVRQVVVSNRLEPASRPWEVPAPLAEGTYILELRATWEPAPAGARESGSRLGRLIRRRRPTAAAGGAVRRVTLAVVGPNVPAERPLPSGRAEHEVDSVDFGRPRGHRVIASGRAPLAGLGPNAWAVPEAALVENPRRDREHTQRLFHDLAADLKGRITRAGSEAAQLPPADSSGLAWSALGLKVAHPGRPHRLTLNVTGGHPSALGVALIEAERAGARPRVALDACASGPPILDDGPPATFSWLVWPGASEPVLVVVNRGSSTPVRIGSATLTELAEVPPGPTVIEPETDRRVLAVALPGPAALDRFGAPSDALAQAKNLGQYLAHCGASSVVLPETLADRASRQALEGQGDEDATGPDRLVLLLRTLGRRGLTAWLDLRLDGPLPGLPAPDTPEALARGLVRVDAQGRADGPAYHPLHPDVRAALKQRVAEAAASWKARSSVTGLLVRLGPGPTLLGGPETGLVDQTFARFVRETFDAETARGVPGMGTDDPERFAVRGRFLAGSGRAPWLTWRSREVAALYRELAEASKTAAPGVSLVVATPGLDDGPAGHEARRVDLAGLAPSHAWRAVGLDLDAWPAGNDTPIILRGVGLSHDDLAHDLATSPDLDAKVAARARRGLLLSVEDDALEAPRTNPENGGPRSPTGTGLLLSASAIADEPGGDEPLGHALAALDARWVVLSASAVTGHEERVRQFARVFRALPAVNPEVPAPDRPPFGVAVRSLRGDNHTYLSLANDSPYPIRLETVLTIPGTAALDDLGRGLRLSPRTKDGESHLVLDLLPFGVATVRVASPNVRLGAITPYPSEAVVAGMQAQYQEMSAQLSRLNQRPEGGAASPPNSGFEPEATRAVTLTMPRAPAAPTGWELTGGMGALAEIDPAQKHSGLGSLRLSSPAPPASVLSERFVPNVHSALTIQAWFRSEHPDARLRLWIEGEAGGRPFVRRSDLTVQPDWAAQAVRASALPTGGLDGARIRLELLTPGTVWVDDLSVSGATLTDPERLNARRALVAALLAYREKRYADFARLAGSHWARHPGLAAEAPPAPRATDPAAAIRTREASALPPDRTLR